VIPVLRVLLTKEVERAADGFEVQVSYKAGKTDQITTLRPMIDLSVFKHGLFQAEQIEVRLEAWAKDPANGGGRIVGEPASSDFVHPATGNVQIAPGHAIKLKCRSRWTRILLAHSSCVSSTEKLASRTRLP
jgi:hypothetical protein